MGILWYCVVWLDEIKLILGVEAPIRFNAKITESIAGISIGWFRGAVLGLSSGAATFVTFTTSTNDCSIQIAYEHYNNRFGIRWSYFGGFASSNDGWRII